MEVVTQHIKGKQVLSCLSYKNFISGGTKQLIKEVFVYKIILAHNSEEMIVNNGLGKNYQWVLKTLG